MSAISSMNVRTNISTQQAHRHMRELSSAQTNAARRLSTGYRINSAADDAAGLAITETMTAQIRGLDQASTNAQDGISLIQTADGAMSGIGDKLHRIRELLVQAANDTYVHGDENNEDVQGSNRVQIQKEIDHLLQGINDMATRAEYNTMALLDGTWMAAAPAPDHPASGTPAYDLPAPTWQLEPLPNMAASHIALIDEIGDNDLHLQIGANALQNMFVSISGMTTHFLGLSGPLPTDSFWIDVRQSDAAMVSIQIDRIQAALDYVSNARANLGSQQVRLEHTRQALDVSSENLSEARSRIRDADMAREMMDFTQMNILFQSGVAMMAHGNRLPETVMQLLQQ